MFIPRLIGLLQAAAQNFPARGSLAVSLGAIAGALSRYYLGVVFAQWLSAVPFATLTANLTGSFLMGILTGLDTPVAPELRLLLATGFLGAYTTFSSYALETAILARTHGYTLALLYWMGSAAFGVVCLSLGTFLAQRLSG